MGTGNVKTDQCVGMLKALADQHRWEIVRTLLGESLSVTELGERLGMTQYNVSKHLRILREAGIVDAEREGKHVHCHIAEGFRRRLAQNQNALDLGCCTFRFDQPK